MFQKLSQCSEEDSQWLDQLNDAQLVDTFKKYSFHGLMALGDVNQRFRELIVNHTISGFMVYYDTLLSIKYVHILTKKNYSIVILRKGDRVYFSLRLKKSHNAYSIFSNFFFSKTSDINTTKPLNTEKEKSVINTTKPLKTEQKIEKELTEKDTEESDHKYLIQAAIVRIMKKFGTMKNKSLIQAVSEELSSRFEPKVPEIKVTFYSK